MPPARGIIVANSEQHSAPVIVSKPASPHASNSQPGAPLNRDDSADTMKIPDPIIEPITIIVASIGPSARTRLVVSLGDGLPSGRTGPALRRGGAPAPFSGRAASIRTTNRGLFRDTATPQRFRQVRCELRFAQRSAISPSSFQTIANIDRSIPIA